MTETATVDHGVVDIQLSDVATTGEIERRQVAVRERLPLDDVRLDLVDSFDKAWEFMHWLGTRHGDVLACDTESGGLVDWRDRLRMVQFGDPMMGWAIPWDRWSGLVLDALRRYRGPLVFHNSPFDVNFIRRHTNGEWQPDWTQIHDTLTLAHLDDPTRTRGLKPLGGMLIDPRAAASQTVLDMELAKNNWTWDTIPVVREGAGSSYWIYAALDTVITARLFDYFHNTRVTYRNAYELEIGTLRCVTDMRYRGARVDLEYCDRMIKTIDEYSAKLRRWVWEQHGIDNATSTAKCIKRFTELGRRITRYTKGGDLSLDKEQLQLFLIGADLDPDDVAAWERVGLAQLPGNNLARAILDLRRGEKFVGPYFRNFKKFADPNGYVHPTIWSVGTRTARQSMTEPALQTMPRKDPVVRDAFIPGDGNVIITIDADQIEMRLAGHFSRDEGLRRAFVDEDDFFNTVASQSWNDVIVKGDPRRQTTKNGCYGKLYGASVWKIAITAGVPIHVMEQVMAQFDDSYPGIRRLQEAIIRVARQQVAGGERPYVVTPTGRRLYGDKGKEYALTNYLIQSHAAEILKRGICDLYNVGLGDYLILPVHDELVLDAPRDDEVEVKMLLERTLNAVGADYFIPLTWSADVMYDRWGDKYRPKTKELIAA